MKLGIVIIGDEILLGSVTDTNSGEIARAFGPLGFDVTTISTVGDKAGDIRAAVERSLDANDLTITTGGLGPTRDDITKTVLTDIFGGTLALDTDVLANVERIFAERGIRMNELTRSQAMVPTSCTVIQNRYGTAPLMCFEKTVAYDEPEAPGARRHLICMPGVPFETRGMLPAVTAYVTEHLGTSDKVIHREFTVAGISESALAERLAIFEDSLPAGYKLAYLPIPGEIVLRLDSTPNAQAAEFEEFATALTGAVGSYLVGVGKISPAERALHAMRQHGWTLATAESCTGGNIAHSITDIAGCSDTFVGAVVSYTNEIKATVLGVPKDILDTCGAVSEGTVRHMTEGACRVCGADCAVATSGIAGPGGATPGKPVGTVWIAARTPLGAVERLYHFPGDRKAVIERATAAALALLCELVHATEATESAQ
ncbi:MAG: CinA family nicotinamide mononucleotide deamidase-related protein [Muribaculaceae bacterium]|nr:CinA family nicotinamide mononucleotide deamidase-related protein [Muribaculaceae bacterium]